MGAVASMAPATKEGMITTRTQTRVTTIAHMEMLKATWDLWLIRSKWRLLLLFFL
jgi:hypothetical protein